MVRDEERKVAESGGMLLLSAHLVLIDLAAAVRVPRSEEIEHLALRLG